MKVVVTGGAGFIGGNLCRHLVAQGHAVTVIDDLSTGHLDNLCGLPVEMVEASVLDREATRAAVRGADSVVHLAAVPSVPRSVADPTTTHAANATGTLELLEACRVSGVDHVVVASSSSVYGANRTLPKRESMLTAPMSPYAVSKLAAESYALAFAHCYGMSVLPFRFFNVYGPLQAAGHAYAAVVPAFVSAATEGVPVTVHGDGGQSRDFTNVGTLCGVLGDAVARRVGSPCPVNLAFGTRTTLNALLDELEIVLDRPVARHHVEARAGDVRDSQADNTLLRALFPGVTAVPLRQGLAETVAWFEAQRANGRAGTPTTVAPSGTSRVTTAPAPT